jgi:hypothetical protein
MTSAPAIRRSASPALEPVALVARPSLFERRS